MQNMESETDIDNTDYFSTDSFSDEDWELNSNLYYNNVDEYHINELYNEYNENILNYLYRNCMIPTLLQIFNHLKLLLFLCAVFNWVIVVLQKVFRKGILSLELYYNMSHGFSFVIGLIALHSFQGFKFTNFLSLTFVIYLALLICEYAYPTKNIKGLVVSSVVAIYLITCELIIFERSSWHTIRGTQMILSMKLISLSFDLDNAVIKRIPSLLHILGYSLHVGSLIFGPWISYHDYLNSLNHASHKLQDLIHWLMKCATSFISSLGCLLVSTCFSELLAFQQSNIWLQAYREALSFRFSHYFVGKLSETTLSLSASNQISAVTVTKILNIELPRSLVDVVVCWNIPMHKWLKIYIFQTSRPLGNFASILLTYLASSLLHGLNFQLSAVLLSLGLYSYIEYNLRRKLSTTFSACIGTRQCKPNCQHKYQRHNPVVIVTNLIFFLISIFHLAYLGCTFDDDDAQTQGYNMGHTLSKWYSLSYSSPLVAMLMMVFNFIL